MILLSGAIFCAGHFVERRESMQTNNKMAVAPVGKLIWQMSIPPLISMFLQYSYNLIDSAFVARLSENALTAVSLSFPITTLMNAASIWIGVGVNVLIAGYLGQKKQDDANTTVTHGLLLAFGIGALLNLLALLIMKPYFRAFTNNEEIYQLSIAYMSVCSFMQIPNMAHIAIQKMIQATGNMVAPMCFQIAGVVVNFVFDPLLIFGIGVFPAMGIRGAAVATVAGYLLSMILAFALLLGKKQKVQVKIKGFHLQKQMIRRIFTLGLPSFIMNALSSFMVTFVNFFLVAYSDTAIAFFGAYFKVQQLIVMTVNGLIQGCLPIMRFNYGAGNSERLHSAFRYGTALVTGMMIKLYSIGIPATLNLALPSLLISALNAILAAYSEVYILVLGIYYKLQTFVYLPANGIVQGMRPLIGYNYGAGEHQRVSQIFKIVLCMSGIIMVFGTVICLLIPGQLMGLFTHTEATIQAGETALRIIGAGFIVSAVSVTSSGALEGLGKGTPSLLISLCRYVVVIIPTAFLLSRFFGAVGVWNAFWITEAITAIISICVYYKAIAQSQLSQSTVK